MAEVPSLVAGLSGPPPFALRLAERISDVGLNGAWLVGHSGAGPLLPLLSADPGPAGYVFVDAGLPHPGVSRLDSLPAEFSHHLRTMADGSEILPPWPEWFERDTLAELLPNGDLLSHFIADCPSLPFGLFTEPLPDRSLPNAPRAYLKLSDAYSPEAAAARSMGWPVEVIDGHHLWPLDHPEETAQAILRLVNRAILLSVPSGPSP